MGLITLLVNDFFSNEKIICRVFGEEMLVKLGLFSDNLIKKN